MLLLRNVGCCLLGICVLFSYGYALVTSPKEISTHNKTVSITCDVDMKATDCQFAVKDYFSSEISFIRLNGNVGNVTDSTYIKHNAFHNQSATCTLDLKVMPRNTFYLVGCRFLVNQEWQYDITTVSHLGTNNSELTLKPQSTTNYSTVHQLGDGIDIECTPSTASLPNYCTLRAPDGSYVEREDDLSRRTCAYHFTVEEGDNGMFMCEVVEGSKIGRKAFPLIVARTNNIELDHDHKTPYVIGEMLTAVCKVDGVRPAPDIEWYLGEQILESNITDVETIWVWPWDEQNITRQINLQIQQNHNNQTLACVVRYFGLTENRSLRIVVEDITSTTPRDVYAVSIPMLSSAIPQNITTTSAIHVNTSAEREQTSVSMESTSTLTTIQTIRVTSRTNVSLPTMKPTIGVYKNITNSTQTPKEIPVSTMVSKKTPNTTTQMPKETSTMSQTEVSTAFVIYSTVSTKNISKQNHSNNGNHTAEDEDDYDDWHIIIAISVGFTVLLMIAIFASIFVYLKRTGYFKNGAGDPASLINAMEMYQVNENYEYDDIGAPGRPPEPLQRPEHELRESEIYYSIKVDDDYMEMLPPLEEVFEECGNAGTHKDSGYCNLAYDHCVRPIRPYIPPLPTTTRQPMSGQYDRVTTPTRPYIPPLPTIQMSRTPVVEYDSVGSFRPYLPATQMTPSNSKPHADYENVMMKSSKPSSTAKPMNAVEYDEVTSYMQTKPSQPMAEEDCRHVTKASPGTNRKPLPSPRKLSPAASPRGPFPALSDMDQPETLPLPTRNDET